MNKQYVTWLLLCFSFQLVCSPVSLKGLNRSFNNKRIQQSDCAAKPENFRVVKTVKSEDDFGKIYLSFIVVNNNVLKSNCNINLLKALNRRLKKNRVKAFLFEDVVVARNFAEGKIRINDISLYIRGLYLYDADQKKEYIKFSSENGKPWDEITIDIQNLNNK